jgi:hypothetical protein
MPGGEAEARQQGGEVGGEGFLEHHAAQVGGAAGEIGFVAEPALVVRVDEADIAHGGGRGAAQGAGGRVDGARELGGRGEAGEGGGFAGGPGHVIAGAALAQAAVEGADEAGQRVADDEDDGFAGRDVTQGGAVGMQDDVGLRGVGQQGVDDGGAAGFCDVQDVSARRRHGLSPVVSRSED